MPDRTPAPKMTTLIDAKAIAKRVAELGEEISVLAKKQQEPLVVICVLQGAFVFFSDLIRHIKADVVCEFLGLSSYGNSTQSSGEVRTTLDLTSSIRGRTVLIVEDIVDTGITLDHLIRQLQIREPKKIHTAALLLKPGSLKKDVKLDYVGFKIGDEFVVGYGLDYQGQYRGLPSISVIDSLQ